MSAPAVNLSEYENQQILVAALIESRQFPHAMQAVHLVETHISWVLLAGRHAYKIKKAVDLGFVDFTGLDRRRLYCEEEIRLNRRLAPSIYQEVVPIGGSPGHPVLGAQPAIEYAVRMRRFAATRQLDRLLARGKLVPETMDRLAAIMAAFHDQIPHADMQSPFGTADSILDAATQNFDQLRSLLVEQEDRDLIVALQKRSESEFVACVELFGQRRNRGFVRECHGDLHLGNVVLVAEQPVPFDGIEFAPRLRWIDVMNEVAFMVMDLLHCRRPDLAYRFLNYWLEATGDYAGLSVLHFYLAYRAVVRAKVNAILAFQAGSADRKAIAACRGYLLLAGECFVRRRMLIITHGLPGSGKSVFALAAAGRLQGIRIRSDVERKRMFGMKPLDKSQAGNDAGIYGAEATRQTYARLLDLARGVLVAGFPVIVDAAFLKRDERERFRALALDLHIPFAIASIRASDAVLQARIRQRHASARDASEADVGVMKMLQANQQPLSQDELPHAMQILNDAGGIIADERVWAGLDRLLTMQVPGT